MFNKNNKKVDIVTKKSDTIDTLVKLVKSGAFKFDVKDKFILAQEHLIKELALELCKELEIEPTPESIKKHFENEHILAKNLIELTKIKTPKV